ncbi:hypothetical protein [Thiofilum flexile]|nr:hypothetical protein [Thiofilum flexile]
MDTQTYQYDTDLELYTDKALEEATATATSTPATPNETTEYWVFDNGICG